MAYGEKYKYFFYWDHDSDNNLYKVSFLYEGYVSTVTELTPTANPWSIDVKGQLDTSENPILGSSAQIQIKVVGAGYTAFDTDFLETDYRDGIVKLIQDPDGTPIIKWVGILQPLNASRTYLGNTKIYSLSAVDGLSDLKNKSYSTTGQNDGSQYLGFDTFLSIIKKALETVADFTELQLDFRINLGTYTDQMTAVDGLLHTDQMLKDNEIVQEIFSEIQSDEIKFDTCYDVLEKILVAFDCTLMQDEGFYYIIATGEKNSFVWEYDWATLTQQSRTQFTKSIDAVDYKWTTKGTLYKTPPYKTYDVRLHNKNYDPELIINGGFDTTVADWTNGDADNDSNPWDDFDFFDYVSIGGTASAQWAGVATAGKYNFHTTAAITLEFGAGKQNVTVWVKVEHFSSTPGGLSAPKIKMRLWNATDGYISGTVGATELGNIGGFYSIRESFIMTGVTVANNFLDIEIEATDALTESLQFYFDNVSMSQPPETDATDWLYTGLRSTSHPEPKERIIYIAESQESDNDICSIKDSGGTYVSTFGRWNFPAETRPLAEIIQQYQFNSNRGYMSYIRGTIYDPDETITIKNVIELTEGDFRIIGIQRDYRSANISVDLIQIIYVGLFLPSDTSFGAGKQKLSSQYGKEQD